MENIIPKLKGVLWYSSKRFDKEFELYKDMECPIKPFEEVTNQDQYDEVF